MQAWQEKNKNAAGMFPLGISKDIKCSAALQSHHNQSRSTSNMVTVDFPVSRPQLVQNVFLSKFHRCTPERLASVLWWCGGDSNSDGEFKALLNFLIHSWSDPNFRPFDDVCSSVAFLNQNMDSNFLIRLSTTQPGGITLTYRKQEGIFHTRFFVNKNETIIDSDNKEHSSISSFCSWFGERSSLAREACPAGYARPSNCST